MTRHLTYTDLRASLKSACDTVCEAHEPLHVSRRHGGDVVVISKEDYDALEETAWLLRAPTNARKLLEAMMRRPEERRTFENVEGLKRALGL